jgi:predicted dehydrogenase
MGITHFSILNTHPSIKIAAVCEQSNTMKRILNKYLDVEIFSDYREMIEQTALDFVVISTPADSHAKIINAAIEGNLHIFTEKPFTLTATQSDETLSLLNGKRLVNQVGYVNRFNEVFMQVKEIINLGITGDIKNFCSEMYGATVLKDSKTTWRSKRKKGGGCMYEFASHCIDLGIYLNGMPDTVTGSVMQSIYSSEVEDFVSSTFIYADGRAGKIIVNWSDASCRRPTNIITIFGSDGKIIADKHEYKIFLKRDHRNLGLKAGWNTRYITDFSKSVRFYVRGNEFTRQLDYFVDCIETSRADNISSFAEAYKTDVVMEGIAKDAERIIQKDERQMMAFNNSHNHTGGQKNK